MDRYALLLFSPPLSQAADKADYKSSLVRNSSNNILFFKKKRPAF